MLKFNKFEDFLTTKQVAEYTTQGNIDMNLGWVRLFCKCGTETEYATAISYYRGINHSPCYVLCENCKDKMTSEELELELKVSLYKAGLKNNYIPIPAPITYLFDDREFLIPRTDGSTSMATVSMDHHKNYVQLSHSFGGWVLYVTWKTSLGDCVGKHVLIDKILELNADNPTIVDAIQKLKKYYPRYN